MSYKHFTMAKVVKSPEQQRIAKLESLAEKFEESDEFDRKDPVLAAANCCVENGENQFITKSSSTNVNSQR